MRSAHHFGPNKGYHHVVAFLTIAHRNSLIKWALCVTSYKRACYTIVGSNNNTRRGQLSKRSQSHREGCGGGEFAERELRGCRKSIRACVAKCGIGWKRGNGWEEAFGNEREAEKKPSSQKQLSMTIRGQTTGEEEDPEQRNLAALTMHELDDQFVSWCLLPQEFVLTAARALKAAKHYRKISKMKTSESSLGI